jgi:flagellin-like protein
LRVGSSSRRRRRGVAGIVGAVLLFAMLFTVGAGYFLFVNQSNLLYTQSLTNRANAMQGALGEGLGLTTSQGTNGDIDLAITNTGGAATTVVELFVTSPAGSVTAVTTQSTPPFPISLNPGATSATIDTSISYTTGTYVIKALTQLGSVFTVDYPQTATYLAAQALSSGAIGDLYLTFQSYSYYYVASSGCPTGTGYSPYCLETASGDTGPGFAIPTATATGKMMAFSIQLTDLNPQSKDIVLDQFTLIYQNVFYGNQHVNLFPWYIANVGTKSGGLIPVLSQYTPVVLHYNQPVTVYFISSTCVQAAAGPNDGCGPFSGAPSCAGGNGQLCNAGTATTTFILSNGWELSPGSYTVGSLTYSEGNYGQNSPFVSTLFY